MKRDAILAHISQLLLTVAAIGLLALRYWGAGDMHSVFLVGTIFHH
jgi:hypothetical protein